MTKYDPLRDHLRRQTRGTYEMSFRDIERVLALLLPKSAQQPEWWANETRPGLRHVQCQAWLEAGFTAHPVKGAERVRFERA